MKGKTKEARSGPDVERRGQRGFLCSVAGSHVMQRGPEALTPLRLSCPPPPSLSFCSYSSASNSNGTYEGRHNKNARAFTVPGLYVYPNRRDRARGLLAVFYFLFGLPSNSLIDRRVYRNCLFLPRSLRPKEEYFVEKRN